MKTGIHAQRRIRAGVMALAGVDQGSLAAPGRAAMKAGIRLRRRVRAGMMALMIGVMAMAGTGQGSAATPGGAPVATEDWIAYRTRFVRPDGRVVDDANSGITHSESQGYGLLLAYLAGDRATFERIWTFTRIELLIRDDGLAAWKWDPEASPHVTDVNNASDGDILIAYALGLAGTSWKAQPYLVAAKKIATALGDKAVRRENSKLLLLPGVTGFGKADRPGGPVVNLSYWIFEAVPTLVRLAPQVAWSEMSNEGLGLIDAFVKEGRLIPEWTSVQDKPVPAEGFDAEFSYNALRVPLYLMRAGLGDRGRLLTFQKAWQTGPGIVDLKSGRVTKPLPEPGYRMLKAAIDCALDATRIPNELRRFEPTLYYPSTLHLLSQSLVADLYPQCL